MKPPGGCTFPPAEKPRRFLLLLTSTTYEGEFLLIHGSTYEEAHASRMEIVRAYVSLPTNEWLTYWPRVTKQSQRDKRRARIIGAPVVHTLLILL